MALLWALLFPNRFMVVGLEWGLSHPVKICNETTSHRVMYFKFSDQSRNIKQEQSPNWKIIFLHVAAESLIIVFTY